MSAWGKSGRVTLDSRDAELPGVRIDGKRVGWLYSPDQGHPRWGARTFDDAPAGFEWIDGAFPSLDAAVLWVLRRVDPALWRQERGEVWTVRKLGRRGVVIEPWHIHRAPGTPQQFENCGCEDDLHEDSHSNQPGALRAALAYRAKAATR